MKPELILREFFATRSPRATFTPTANYGGSSSALSRLLAVTDLFRSAPSFFVGISDEVIADGLDEVVFCGRSNFLGELLSDLSLPVEDRRACVEACFPLFDGVFRARCTNALFTGKSKNPLDRVCFMWWDLFPHAGDLIDADSQAVHEMAFVTMGRILRIQHDGCQQSALHGLLDWAPLGLTNSKAVVEDFIASGSVMSDSINRIVRSLRDDLGELQLELNGPELNEN